jgi:hypothetical protein
MQIPRHGIEVQLARHLVETLEELAEGVVVGAIRPDAAIEKAYELGWRMAERRAARQLTGIVEALRHVAEVTDAAAREMNEDTEVSFEADSERSG